MACWTNPLTSELPSLVLVWPSNCGSASLTEMTAVSPSLVGVDGVGVGVNRLRVATGPLQCDLKGHVSCGVLELESDDLGVHRFGPLGRDQVLDVVDEAILVAVGHRARLVRLNLEIGLIQRLGLIGVLCRLDSPGALVGQCDGQSLVQEGHLLEPST